MKLLRSVVLLVALSLIATTASTAYAGKRTIAVTPSTVSVGKKITASGSGFKANSTLYVFVGPDATDSDALSWAVRTDSGGKYSKKIPISATNFTGGKYVAVACQTRSCTQKASAKFVVSS